MIRGLHHGAIATNDVERLFAFYRDLFGLEVVLDYTWEDNGSGALNSPGFGFETEPSERAADRTDSWKSSAWKRRRRAGAMTS
jgi:catechol 2,3-dioxygenase-like lactoylglutathione lyase family enzyme